MSILDFVLLNAVLVYLALRFFLNDWAVERFGFYRGNAIPLLFLGAVSGALYLFI